MHSLYHFCLGPARQDTNVKPREAVDGNAGVKRLLLEISVARNTRVLPFAISRRKPAQYSLGHIAPMGRTRVRRTKARNAYPHAILRQRHSATRKVDKAPADEREPQRAVRWDGRRVERSDVGVERSLSQNTSLTKLVCINTNVLWRASRIATCFWLVSLPAFRALPCMLLGRRIAQLEQRGRKSHEVIGCNSCLLLYQAA